MITEVVEDIIAAAVCEFEAKLMRSSYNTPQGRYTLVMAKIPTFHMNSDFVRNVGRWTDIIEKAKLQYK